jgi:enoyl-CoA hydratase/carnithine racemase
MVAAPGHVGHVVAMTAPQLKVSVSGSTVLWQISNPDAKNALAPEIYAQGLRAIKEFADRDDLRCAILAGENGFFCAGGNLNRLLKNTSENPDVQRDSINALHDWVRAIRSSAKPIIAAVDTAAAGAGFSIALACDMLVTTANAKFVMAYANVGLTPDGGATFSLTKKIPSQLAFEIFALGRPALGQRLFDLGVVNLLATANQKTQAAPALYAAFEVAARFALMPPNAVGRIKQLLNDSEYATFEEQLELERESFVAQLHSDEGREGIARFLTKGTLPRS